MNADEIVRLLHEMESNRKRGNYEDVILISNDINRLLEDFENGRLQIIGILDVDFVKIEMGWILAYTYFNLQNYEQMEKCIYWDGVIDAHPWVLYLLAIAHRVQNAPRDQINQDLYRLLDICNNSKLDRQEYADVNAMIGDLLLDGYGDGERLPTQRARTYLEEAKKYGNMYAVKTLRRLD